MNEKSRLARQKMKAATKSEYETWVKEAALTPSQTKVLALHILEELSIPKISLKTHISERTVTEKLKTAYKKLAKLL